MKAAHVLATAAVLAAAGVVISLAMAFQPSPEDGAGHAAVSPAARSRAVVPAALGSPTSAGSLARAAGPAIATARTTRRGPRRRGPRPRLPHRRCPPEHRWRDGSSPASPIKGSPPNTAPGDGDGACLFGPASNLMIAAMNYTDYDTAQACGAYVLVRAADGASVTVLITNECPLPCAPGQLDLSQQAFAKIANPTAGRIPITWKLLSPSMSSTVSIRYMTGSSRWWCGIQVIGHRNPVALLEVRTSGGWRRLPRTSYNYFISPDGSGCGGPIRITDIYGQQLTIKGIALLPNVRQPTRLQFARH